MATIPRIRTLSTGKSFLKRYLNEDIHGEYHRQFMIWLANKGISLMPYNWQKFITGTFKSVHRPFPQYFIIMIHDA
ncbi:hypothetical protein HZS_2418 [Henneguya salminicola]|nr:hypothetical protein HZS_2418 [Henneguya salminicola]